MSELDEYYAILELPPGASKAEVKTAFRNLAKAWHPDLYPYSGVLRQRCEEKMRKINEAYDVLRRAAPDEPGGPAAAPDEPPVQEESPPPEPEAEYKVEPEPRPEPDPYEEPDPWLEPWRRPPPHARKRRPFKMSIAAHKPDYEGLTRTGIGFALGAAALASNLFVRQPVPEALVAVGRVVACLGAFHGAYYAAARNYWESVICLILLGAVLNPVAPVPMAEDEWRLFCVTIPVVFFFIWFAMFGRETRRGV